MPGANERWKYTGLHSCAIISWPPLLRNSHEVGPALHMLITEQNGPWKGMLTSKRPFGNKVNKLPLIISDLGYFLFKPGGKDCHWVWEYEYEDDLMYFSNSRYTDFNSQFGVLQGLAQGTYQKNCEYYSQLNVAIKADFEYLNCSFAWPPRGHEKILQSKYVPSQ